MELSSLTPDKQVNFNTGLDRGIYRSTPAVILHIGSITVELYEGTSVQMLETVPSVILLQKTVSDHL